MTCFTTFCCVPRPSNDLRSYNYVKTRLQVAPPFPPDFGERWNLDYSFPRFLSTTTTHVGPGALTRPAERMLRDDVGDQHSAAWITSGAQTAPDARARASGPTWFVVPTTPLLWASNRNNRWRIWALSRACATTTDTGLPRLPIPRERDSAECSQPSHPGSRTSAARDRTILPAN